MTIDLPLARTLRGLRRRPAFSVAVVVTLALGFGANIAIFSFVNALVLKPLPFADPGRLAWIFAVDARMGENRSPLSLPEYARFRRETRSLDGLAGRFARSRTLGGVPSGALRVLANEVMGDLHGTWGLHAELGRVLAASDESPSAAPVVVLSHHLWQRAFGGSSDAVGRTLPIDGTLRRVVGVLPPDVEFGTLGKVDLWIPFQGDPALAAAEPRDVKACGRLRPGATLAQADAEVAAVGARLAAEDPAAHEGWRARATDTTGAVASSGQWFTLVMLFTVVTLLLVLACANVANLQLAALIERRSEHAVRAALGASRAGIIGGLLYEGLLLGALGSAVGVGLAAAILRLLRTASSEPIFRSFAIDRNVLLFAAGLAVLAPLLFVVPAALRMLGGDPALALRAGGRGADPGGRRRREVLIGTQIAVALALLVVSGLVTHSVVQQLARPFGFDPARVLTFHLELGDWRYPTEAEVGRTQQRLLSELAALPGVDSVALGSSLPLIDSTARTTFQRSGVDSAGGAPWAELVSASASYLDVLRVPLLAGRAFGVADRADTAPVVLVSRAAAERYWQSADRAVGSSVTLELAGGRRTATVVGVVADLEDQDPMRSPNPRLYVLASQAPPRAFAVAVRGALPESLIGDVRRTVTALAPDVAIDELRPFAAAIADETSSDRLIAGLFGGFAVVALLLATVGLYGVLAYTAARRGRELAVRAACGAAPADLRRLLLGQGLRLAAVGAVAGLGLAGVLARLMAAKLNGISPVDPTAFGGSLAVILLCALAAALRPARRAGRVDPAAALRSD